MIPFFADARYKTGADLDMPIEGAFHIAALPDGQAAIHHTSNDHVLIMNGLGQVVRRLYIDPPYAFSLQVQCSESFIILFMNGTIVEMHSQDGRILNVYETGVEKPTNRGSSCTDICYIPKDIILFTKYPVHFNYVFGYNLSSQTLKVNVKGLSGVYSVTSGCVNGSVVYIVSECQTHKVHVYNGSWSLITSFGGQGSGNGQLYNPFSAVMSQGHIFVADYDNYRVSMFTSDGQFVKHILTYKYPNKPWVLSVSGQYLWVTIYTRSNPVRRLVRYII